MKQMRKRTGGERNLRLMAVIILGIAGFCGMANFADAEETKTAADASAIYDFNIPQQSVAKAVAELSAVARLQVLYTQDKPFEAESNSVKGKYTVEGALRIMLEGTGVTYRFVRPGVITLDKLPDTTGAHLTAPVRVQGATENGAAGINGSTDPTATEGTKSYTSSALSIASKTAQSIKDTPVSVSVITQQRMQDQNLTDFSSAMNQATGITVVTGGTSGSAGTNLEPVFYSRGFQISSIQLDGGAPLNMTSGAEGAAAFYPLIDMAEYDHVEILRGADGLFNGYGDPSGSVNLTRKRPLDHEQVVVELADGSWNNSREMIDATAPLGFDGKLRGRFVISNQDQDYFYNTANTKHTLAYGILEADLSPTTLASIGFSDTRQDARPWFGGLMRYSNGNDLDLPRSTCLCFPWNRWDFDTKELFAQVEQHFGDDWSAKLNFTRDDQQSHEKVGYTSGFYQSTVNPVTGTGPVLIGLMRDFSGIQTMADFNVNGAFDLFGHRQQIVFGGNYQDVDGAGYKNHDSLFPTYPPNYAYSPVDVLHFNPNNPLYAEPASSVATEQYPVYDEKQSGAYATFRLTLLDPLHAIIGWRYSWYGYNYVQQGLCTRVSGTCVHIGDVASTSHYDFTDHHLSSPPDIALLYDLSHSVSAYVSYSDINQPQSTEVDESGKPLSPITGYNAEAGLKWEGFSGKLNGTIAAYRIEQKNYGLFTDYGKYADTYGDTGDGIHYCCYTNGSNQVNLSKGVDIEVTGEVLPGWQLFAGYTFNLNKAEGSDAYNAGQALVSRTPKHLLKLWTSYQFQNGDFWRRLNIGGGMNAQTASYYSGRACINYVLDANGNQTGHCKPGANLPYNFTQGFYAVFSGRVAYQIDKRWTAALNFNNITDRRYYQTMGNTTGGNWYGDPRNFMLTLRGTY